MRDTRDESAPREFELINKDASFDEGKVDEAVLAVLYTSAFDHEGTIRAWKSINWESTNRLFELGLIRNPRSMAKSVAFTEEGLGMARAAAQRLFGGQPAERGVYGTAPAVAAVAEDQPPADAFGKTFY